jgi:Na+/proline symporter
MGLLGLIFFYIGISMGWLYVSIFFCFISEGIVHFLPQTFMGVILGSAVVPIALAITWKKANKWGCIGGSIAGFIAGIVAWLVTTATLNDSVINVVVSRVAYSSWSNIMLKPDFRQAAETMKCWQVILQPSVWEESLPPYLPTW